MAQAAMWCIGAVTEEYRQRMYDLLALYGRPFQPQEPVVCLDEKSNQLLRDTRTPLPVKPGVFAKQDYEYARGGTCNLFVAVEPKGGRPTVVVTDHRAKPDFVAFVRHLLEQVYATAHRVHLVRQTISTLTSVAASRKSWASSRRGRCYAVPYSITLQNTPVGSIWPRSRSAYLSASVLIALPDRATLTIEVDAWQQRRNNEHRCIEWTFTRQDADHKMQQYYVS